MHTDPRRQAQALEFLFLFHACKLTNHRPDQSVSLADVARVAGLTQDQSEQLCASLREARLIRYSSLLGDISVTRFGVSEVVATKACPHSGANYFPAVKQMGLRLSRGHHLFDDLELSRARDNDSSLLDQSVDVMNGAQSSGLASNRVSETLQNNFSRKASSSRAPAAGVLFSQTAPTRELVKGSVNKPLSGIRTEQISKSNGDNDQHKTASQVRQEIITELEQLLEQIGGKTGRKQKSRQSRQQTKLPVTTSQVAAQSQDVNQASTPSLLLNPEWKPGFKLQGTGQSARITKQSTRPGIKGSKPAAGSNAKHGRDEMNGQDVSLSVERLNELMQNWCQTIGSKKAQANLTGCFLIDLEQINESLFSFT